MKEIIVTKAEAGQRFDRYLKKYMPEAASGFLHKMLRKKNIKLNGNKAEGNEKIREGDSIQIYFSEETLAKFTGRTGRNVSSVSKDERPVGKKKPSTGKREESLRQQVHLLYATEDILIFHKPAGMLTQKARPEDDSINDYLLDYCWKNDIIKEGTTAFRPSVANRLDRNTSGIVLCGITTAGLQTISRMLRKRELEKYYLCIVQGTMREDRKIKGWLIKDEKKNTVTLSRCPAEGASPVETWYQVLDTSPEATLLKVRLITGKSHQIRAHLASEGHPVLGDYKYGRRAENDRLKRKTGINHQLLHSYELKMTGSDAHAASRMLHVIDPPPAPFRQAMEFYGLSLNERRR